MPSICPRRRQDARAACTLLSWRLFRAGSARKLSCLALVALLAACGQGPAAFGPDPDTARANAAEMLGAFATRFTSVRRIGALDRTHDQFVRHALFPSKLIDDTTLWSGSRSGPKRTLSVYGTLVGAQYHLAARAAAPHPHRAGDVRVVTSISRLAESEFLWEATSELGLGTLSADEFFRGLKASVAELESRAERDTRAEYRASLPRGTAALGTLFSLDSIRTQKLGDGSTAHRLVIGIDPDRARATYPAFGRYLAKYVKPSRYHLTLTDRTGALWMDVQAGKDLLRIRMRTRDGEMLPLDGAARPLPDSLQLRADLTLHVLFFDVGMSELAADVQVVRTDHERGFSVRFRREPKWHFPLATNRLIKTPLRRPFANEGSLFRLTVRDSAGAQTVISRQVRMAVQESAILRWLARLNRTAADDFTASADVESNRFVSDVFGALRSDVRAQRTVQAKAKAEGEY